MRKFLAVLTCSVVLIVGPCSLESWNIAVSPGFGDRESFIGVELDFGDLDFVVPVFIPNN